MGQKNIGLKINEAITRYNEERPADAERMTQRSLGLQVFGGQFTEVRAGWYISQWQIGEETTKMKPQHVVAICKATGVDPNFLFGWNK